MVREMGIAASPVRVRVVGIAVNSNIPAIQSKRPLMIISFFHARQLPLTLGSEYRLDWRRVMKSEPEEKIDDLFEAGRQNRSCAFAFMIASTSAIIAGPMTAASRMIRSGVQSA